MKKRIPTWVSVLVGAVVVLALFSALIVSRLSAPEQTDGPAGVATQSPLPGDTAPLAGLPGTNAPVLQSDSAPRATQASSPTDISQSQIVPNVGPIDSTLLKLDPGPRLRTALDVVLRKGIIYQVKERKPDVIRYIVGAAFFAEPAKYRNPLMRNLYHANLVGRTASQPRLYFEFWDLRQKFGEYVADTFYLGPRYAKPR